MAKRQMKEKNATVLVLPFLFFIFSIILLVSSPSNLKTNIFKNQDYIEIINSETITNTLLLMIGEGVPQFKDFLEREVEIPSITEVAFESITGIKTDNISTLLLHEIPGFNRATTRIYIAGEGSDYSNLPNESPPPNFDELLKEEDSNKEQAQNSENKSNEESSTDKINDPSVFIY